MTKVNQSQKLLIFDMLKENFKEVPFPAFANLYDRSCPVQYPEFSVTSFGQHHEIRIAAEEFRNERPFMDYDFFHFEVAFSCFSAEAHAYFTPKILQMFVAQNEGSKVVNFEERFFEFLQDDRSNKNARLFDEMTKLYSFKQRQMLGMTILFLCYRGDIEAEDYTSTWFYKETLKVLFDPEAG